MFIPLSVPEEAIDVYSANFARLTGDTGRLFLLSYDQRIEHLNDDFSTPTLPVEAQNVDYPFIIATSAGVSALATQLGLIAQYGATYDELAYVVKLTGKTNSIPASTKDPLSIPLWSVDDVVRFQESSGIEICGVGATIYLGSEYESEMLSYAAQMIFEAHQNGLITILWIYARGKAIKNERAGHLIAGAAGVAHALGADFVKLNMPDDERYLLEITRAAGRTGILYSGGEQVKEQELIQRIQKQITSGSRGCAIGRNIFQRSHAEAISLCEKISEILYSEEANR